jgi:very-short-patch-repair endonuclease
VFRWRVEENWRVGGVCDKTGEIAFGIERDMETQQESARLRRPGHTRTRKAREFSRELRQKETAAERRLWRLLRDRRFSGYKFRRQFPIGPYYLDFYCPESGLAVELDGGVHGEPEKKANDEERDDFLRANGIVVLRFWNHQLGTQIEVVRSEIWRALMGAGRRT